MRFLLAAATFMAVAGAAFAQPAIAPAAAPPAPVVTLPAPAARAAAGLVTTTDTGRLIAALGRAGFTAEVKTEGRASYVLGHLDNVPFQAFLTGCSSPGVACTDIELYAGFTGAPRIPLERINGWNARTRFARAFLDEDGDPALQMDLSLQGGLSPDNFKAALETWGTALETYSLFLIARVPPVGAVAAPGAQPAVPGPPKR